MADWHRLSSSRGAIYKLATLVWLAAAAATTGRSGVSEDEEEEGTSRRRRANMAAPAIASSATAATAATATTPTLATADMGAAPLLRLLLAARCCVRNPSLLKAAPADDVPDD